jgi:hypothetical protein
VQNRETLIDLSGLSGQNGTLGRLRDSMGELDTKLKETRAEISTDVQTIKASVDSLRAFRWKLLGGER